MLGCGSMRRGYCSMLGSVGVGLNLEGLNCWACVQLTFARTPEVKLDTMICISPPCVGQHERVRADQA
jgi:hypothetical protein